MLLDAGVGAVDELDVREGEVADLAVELALPLPRDVHLGHRHDLAHLQPQRRLVVRARHPGLLHPRVRRKFALKEEGSTVQFQFGASIFGRLGLICCRPNFMKALNTMSSETRAVPLPIQTSCSYGVLCFQRRSDDAGFTELFDRVNGGHVSQSILNTTF